MEQIFFTGRWQKLRTSGKLGCFVWISCPRIADRTLQKVSAAVI